MKVMFLRAVKGYAYFRGDVGDVPDEEAGRLVGRGVVSVYQGEDECTLPEGMPARQLLHEAGFRTVAEVLAAREGLEEVKGIGHKMAERIVEYCERYEG